MAINEDSRCNELVVENEMIAIFNIWVRTNLAYGFYYVHIILLCFI